MKKSLFLFATVAVLGFSSSAFAGKNTDYSWSEPKLESSKTRTEVRAELEQAYNEGTLTRGANYNYPAVPEKSMSRTAKESQHNNRSNAHTKAEVVFMYGA